MTKLKTYLKHFLLVVLPLALSGASAFADSSSFRHYVEGHTALAVYVPVVAGLLKATHAVLPKSPYTVSVKVQRRGAAPFEITNAPVAPLIQPPAPVPPAYVEPPAPAPATIPPPPPPPTVTG